MIKKNIKEGRRGFTIVELLVVIVVIAILAAISIVSYTGVTTKAKQAKAQNNAQSAQSVAETYYADNGAYPATTTALETGGTTAKLPGTIDVVVGLAGSAVPIVGTDPITLATAENRVSWACLTSCTNATGGRITYWNYAAGSSLTAASIVYVGYGTSTGAYVAPAS